MLPTEHRRGERLQRDHTVIEPSIGLYILEQQVIVADRPDAQAAGAARAQQDAVLTRAPPGGPRRSRGGEHVLQLRDVYPVGRQFEVEVRRREVAYRETSLRDRTSEPHVHLLQHRRVAGKRDVCRPHAQRLRERPHVKGGVAHGGAARVLERVCRTGDAHVGSDTTAAAQSLGGAKSPRARHAERVAELGIGHANRRIDKRGRRRIVRQRKPDADRRAVRRGGEIVRADLSRCHREVHRRRVHRVRQILGGDRHVAKSDAAIKSEMRRRSAGTQIGDHASLDVGARSERDPERRG